MDQMVEATMKSVFVLADDPKKDELLTKYAPKKIESDPTGAQPHTPGAKLDSGKAKIMQGVIQYFPRALKAVSGVSEAGAEKYTWNGWESVPDGINRYGNAMGRHLLAAVTEGPYDKDTGCLHAAQVAWNAMAVLELTLRRLERSTHEAATEKDESV